MTQKYESCLMEKIIMDERIDFKSEIHKTEIKSILKKIRGIKIEEFDAMFNILNIAYHPFNFSVTSWIRAYKNKKISAESMLEVYKKYIFPPDRIHELNEKLASLIKEWINYTGDKELLEILLDLDFDTLYRVTEFILNQNLEKDVLREKINSLVMAVSYIEDINHMNDIFIEIEDHILNIFNCEDYQEYIDNLIY